MTSAATFDAGPLSWVKGEIDLALDRVTQGLQQFGADTADLAQIKFCRTHLHQVRGALTIVGLDGATQFTDVLEALLADIEGGRQPADSPRIALIGRSIAAIRRFLDDLLAGDPNQPLRLFDLYAQIAVARGLPAPSASELFFPEISTHPQLPAVVIADNSAERLKTARARYQKGLLAFIKAPETPIGALELKLAAQMAASADNSPTLRGFWWVAGGFFTALGEKSIANDVETKSLCTRIDQQLRQQSEGSRAVPEKLMRDALYQVAIARSRNADVLAIKEAYGLADLIPAADAKTVSQAAQIEPLLRRLKEIATASEEAWNKFCTGSEQSLKTFCEAAAALDQGAERLAHTDFRRLIGAVGSTANWIREDRKRHSDTVALEVATGILLIGNGVDNFTRLGADFVHQVDVMVARLHACIAGNPPTRDDEVPVLDEMTRRAQEKLLIAQVVKEIQSSLGQIEQALDTFFREPDQKEQLAGCSKPIGQIVGALSILGHLDAVAQLQESARQIARFQAVDYQPDQQDFERVARQLSALGFFVEALRAGATGYQAFVANLEVKPSKVEVAVEKAAKATVPESVAAPLTELVVPVALEATAEIVREPSGSVTTVEERAAVPQAVLPAAETPVIDAELLEIFLEEAQEVAATISQQLDVLREQPSDAEALTTLRRAFHTLKGSSRMVGLMDFGEVAWVIEQVHNLWLRQEKPADASLIALVEAAQAVFSAWIGHLAGSGEVLPDARDLVAMGEKLKGTETVTAPGRPLPVEATGLEPDLVAEEEMPEGLVADADGAGISFNLDLPVLEISKSFAPTLSGETAIQLAESSLATEPEQSVLESALDEAAAISVVEPESGIELEFEGEAEPVEFAPGFVVAPVLEFEESVADLPLSLDEGGSANEEVIDIGLGDAMAVEREEAPEPADVPVADDGAEADGAVVGCLAEELAETPLAGVAPSGDVESIDLVSLVVPPGAVDELLIDLSEPTGAPLAFVEATASEEVASEDEQAGAFGGTDDTESVLPAGIEPTDLVTGEGVVELLLAPESEALAVEQPADIGVEYTEEVAVDHDVSPNLAVDEVLASSGDHIAGELLSAEVAETALVETASSGDVESIELVSLVAPLGAVDELLIDLSEPEGAPPGATETINLETVSADEIAIDIAIEEVPADAPATDLASLDLDLAGDNVSEGSVAVDEAVPLRGAGENTPCLDVVAEEVVDETSAVDEVVDERPESALPAGQTITVAPTLYQIFLEEAHQHLAALQRCFGELEIAPEVPTPQEMVRAAHTLGSISGTVGFQSLLKLGRAVEAALLRRDKAGNRASLEALETVRIAIAELESMVEAIERNEPMRDAAYLLVQVDDLYPGAAAETLEAVASSLTSLAETQAPVDEPLPDDQLDESLLPIFVEEAADLVAGINERFGMWSANPYDTDTIHALTRLLHTLKGSARMAGAMRLGALTHRLESSLEAAHRAGGADPVLVAALQAEFDDIAEMAERLGESPVGPVPTPSDEHIDESSIEQEASGFDEMIDLFVPDMALPEELAADDGVDVADAGLAAGSDTTQSIDLLADSVAVDDSAVSSDRLTPIESEDSPIETIALESPAVDMELAGETVDAGEAGLLTEGAASSAAALDADVLPEDDELLLEASVPDKALQEFVPDATLAASESPFVLPAVPEALTTPAAGGDVLPEDHLDPDLLPIFLEEAVEIVRTVYEQLDAWQAAPTDGVASHGLARSLHTLKGSARMAGAMSLGALTHILESRAEEASRSGLVSVVLIEEMKHAFDVIAQIVERLQRGESLADLTISLPPAAESRAPTVSSAAVIVPAETPSPVVASAPADVARPVAPPRAAVAAAATPSPVPVAVASRKDSDAAKAMLRVPANLIDMLVNDAGELSIARARIEGEMRSLKQSLLDLTENVIRLRRQLREIEIQAESQMQSRTAISVDGKAEFDPLELDRFTRFQEVTRMMAESVNDVATVQLNLLKNLDEANAGLAAQARLNRELQQSLMAVRMVPFSSITERLFRIVRQTAKELGKRADLDVKGAGIELDQNVINKMIGPFEHLLRNAISHGIETPAQRVEQGKEETGQIQLSLRQEGNEVIITMQDDGAGLNFSRIREKAIAKGLISADEPFDERKLTEMIFHSGFSTATQVSQIAGRGVGMDVVMTEVTNLGGRIDVSSETGKGSVFRIYLPLTLAVTNAVIVRIGLRYYAIPAAMIDQVQELKESALTELRNAGGADWLGNRYPFHFLPHLLGEPEALPEARRMYWVLYLHSGLQRVAVQVDELQSSHEIVVKNIGPQLARVVGIAGATVMGDGRVILILNPVALAARAPVVAPVMDSSAVSAADGAEATGVVPEPEKAIHLPTVLVVDDSLTVRKITGRLLAREGYQVITAKDGQDALEQMVEVIPDVILSDIEMPRMDGFELARNIRADERLVNIPIIMISSRTADKHRSHAAELGVQHFLGKPYQEEELLGLISEFIARQRAAA